MIRIIHNSGIMNYSNDQNPEYELFEKFIHIIRDIFQ